ncbi:MAG: YybH family protein [Gemmatimonadales bacterium]
MRRESWSLVLLAVLAGCNQPGEFTPAARAAVGDTIRAQAERVIAALGSKDVDQLVALFTPDSDFVYVDNGRIYPDRPALKAAASGFFRRLGSASGRWDPAHVLPLSPSAGAFTGVFRPQMADTAGTPLWVDGKIWTFVYERRAGQWLIVQAHEVNALPPR